MPHMIRIGPHMVRAPAGARNSWKKSYPYFQKQNKGVGLSAHPAKHGIIQTTFFGSHPVEVFGGGTNSG